jgi:hypothetical protein
MGIGSSLFLAHLLRMDAFVDTVSTERSDLAMQTPLDDFIMAPKDKTAYFNRSGHEADALYLWQRQSSSNNAKKKKPPSFVELKRLEVLHGNCM